MKLKLILTDPIKRKERIFFSAFTAIFIGTLIGILYSCKSENTGRNDLLDFALNSGLAFKNGSYTVYEILRNNFIGIFLLILILFISGFFAFGQIVAVAALIYRGFSFGNAVYLILNEFGVQGILVALLLIFPFGIFSCVVTFFASRETIRCSNNLFKYIFIGEKKENMTKNIKYYLLRFVALIVFIVIAIAIQAFLLMFCIRFVIG
jgi:hypothetical protein